MAHPDEEQWQVVDEGWGRRAVEFATLSEPTNCREYVTMHHRLGVGPGDRLLDIACGAGLAVELATLRGARCAGIDASLTPPGDRPRPNSRRRPAGRRHERACRGTTDPSMSSPASAGSGAQLPAPWQRRIESSSPVAGLGLTVWGHIKVSPGAWAFAPFVLAAEPKVQNQAAMVALGRPGAGEALLSDMGFTEVERIEVPFVFEFSDPDAYARALASTGPAFEAIQAVGEKVVPRVGSAARRSQQTRQGLPLRAPIALVGYLAAQAR